jgi:hypothetical protein
MSKRANDPESKRSRPATEESAPPPLSEKLIAQLQGAVCAARHKRMSDPDEVSATRSLQEESGHRHFGQR